MILSFKHKGLERFFAENSKRGIQPAHAGKLTLILTALNAATFVDQMKIPGLDLHSLQPSGSNLYAVKVNANWRVTFIFMDGNAEVVDYLDYH